MVKTTKKETLTHLGKNFWNHLHLHSPLKNPDEDTRRSRGKKEALHALNTRLNPHERNTEREERKRYKKQKTFSFFFLFQDTNGRLCPYSLQKIIQTLLGYLISLLLLSATKLIFSLLFSPPLSDSVLFCLSNHKLLAVFSSSFAYFFSLPNPDLQQTKAASFFVC